MYVIVHICHVESKSFTYVDTYKCMINRDTSNLSRGVQNLPILRETHENFKFYVFFFGGAHQNFEKLQVSLINFVTIVLHFGHASFEKWVVIVFLLQLNVLDKQLSNPHFISNFDGYPSFIFSCPMGQAYNRNQLSDLHF